MHRDATAPHLLAVKEVAARLRLHPVSVYRKIERGEIPALRLGGPGSAIRVDAAEFEAWLFADPAGVVTGPLEPAERGAPDFRPAVEAPPLAGRERPDRR